MSKTAGPHMASFLWKSSDAPMTAPNAWYQPSSAARHSPRSQHPLLIPFVLVKDDSWRPIILRPTRMYRSRQDPSWRHQLLSHILLGAKTTRYCGGTKGDCCADVLHLYFTLGLPSHPHLSSVGCPFVVSLDSVLFTELH